VNNSESSATVEDLEILVSRYRDELKALKLERNDAIAALGDCQRQLSETQRRVGIGSWERRLDTDKITWSDELYRIFGFEPDSTSPSLRSIMEAIHEDDRERVKVAVRKRLEGNLGLELTYRIRRPDGDIRVIHTKSIVENDENEKPIRQYGTARDVTHGRSIESGTIANTNSKSDHDSASVFVLLCDENGTITYANEAFEKATSAIRFGDAVHDGLSSLPVPLQTAIEDVRRNRHAQHVEFCFADSEAGMLAFDAFVEPILTNNAVSGFSIFALPVTRRNERNQVLWENERSLSEALRIASLGHWERDLTNHSSKCSDQTYRILGVDRDTFDASTDNFIRMVHPDDVQDVSTVIKNCFEHGEAFELEFRIVRPDGDVRYLLTQAERVRTVSGNLKAIGTVLDVTDRRLVLDSLRQANIKSNALFDEMHRAYEQLLQMTRRLSKIQEEERSRIALDLHDEAGGLLAAIQLSLQLINNVDSEHKEYVDRAETLVDELIERIDHFTHRLRPASLDRLGLRSTLLAHFSEFQDRHGIILNAEVDLEDEKSIAEDTQIAAYRIVQEGLTNVARHAFVQSASVRIHRQEDQLEIVIADQGLGIVEHSAEESENIGISGMRERASLLGGSVAVQSTPGEGTKLIARLPVSTVRNFCRDFTR